MSETKRFKLRLSKLGNGMITDAQKREDLYFDKEFLDVTLPLAIEWLNELADKNEQLKSFIQKLQNSDGNIVLINGQGYTKSYIGGLLE